MSHILIIDDAPEITTAVVHALEPVGLKVSTAENVSEGLAKANATPFDLVIIDIVLPDGDGFELYSQLRKLSGYAKTPVIFLTSKEDVSSKVNAFSQGADDYIVKPFNLLELQARVKARLNKHIENNSVEDEINVGPFAIDIGAQKLKIHGEVEPISLSPREFKIFLMLARQPEKVFSRDSILDKIWGKDVHVTGRTVDAHVCYLRKKLKDHGAMIESVPGRGYRYTSTAKRD